jgi:hypothetical protein
MKTLNEMSLARFFIFFLGFKRMWRLKFFENREKKLVAKRVMVKEGKEFSVVAFLFLISDFIEVVNN